MALSTVPLTTAAAPYQASTLASGLNDQQIISELVSLKQQPITNLQNQETSYNTEISTYGNFASQVSAFQQVADALGSSGLQATQVASQNVSFTATTSGSAQPGEYTVEVDSIAQAAKALSQSFTTAQSAVTGGVLTINSGGTAYNVNITDGMQLADVATAINNSGAPVNAAILNTGSGYYLSITNQNSGYTPGQAASSALSISETTTGTQGQSLAEAITQQATNADFKVDNLEYVRQTNVVSDAIPGVTLTLNSQSQSLETLNIVSNANGSLQLLQNFVSAYNTLQNALNTQLVTPTNGAPAGPMSGDATLEDLERQLQALSSTIVPGQSGVTSLADLGVKTANDGTLSVDPTAFNKAIAANPAAANTLFTAKGGGIAALVDNIATLTTDPLQGSLVLRQNELKTDVQNDQKRVTDLQDQITTYQAQLTAEFTTMETLVSSLKNQGQFLTENVGLFTGYNPFASSSGSSSSSG